jgi:Zn-finger nucleic acid-binding protein
MGGSHGVIECSHCKEDYGVEYDYCPSCGALMDGKDSDSVAKQA